MKIPTHLFPNFLASFELPARLFLAATLLDGVIYSAWQLFFNFYILERGFSREFLGLVTSTTSAAALLLGIPLGMLSDRIGRKRAMLLGMTFYVLGAAVEVTVLTPELILGAAFISGAGQSLFFLSHAPFMMKASSPQNRTLLFSLNFGLITLAGAAGNIFAGQLPALFGNLLGVGARSAEAYQAVLLVSAAASSLTLVPLALIKEPKSLSEMEGSTRAAAPIWRVLTRPVVLKLTLPNLLIGFGAASLIPYMNVFFNDKHAIPDQTLGLLFSLLSLTTGIGSIFSPKLEKLLKGKIPAVAATQAISQVFLLLVGFSPQFPVAAAAFLLRGTLMNMAVPLFDAFSMEQVPEQDQGTVNSLRNLSWQVGWTVGPFLSGMIQVRYGFAPLFIGTAALYSLATLLTWKFFHKSETAHLYCQIPGMEAVSLD